MAGVRDPGGDDRSAQDRLETLLRANREIVGDLDLNTVLRRLVESACDLLDVRYGALGVLEPDGHGLIDLIHVGMSAEVVANIARAPEGLGLLEAVVHDPHPINLTELGDDPRSVGFPDGHPPMSSFLGVPIRVRGQAFGNLYLTERRGGGRFTEEEVEVAEALAASAAIAIENARLYDDARRRQEWLEATAAVSLEILSSAEGDILRLIAETVRELAEADVVTVVLPSDDRERLNVEVAVGMGADRLSGWSYPMAGTLTGKVLDSGVAQSVGANDPEEVGTVHMREVIAVGPVMALPLVGPEQVQGALVVGKAVSAGRFSDAEVAMAGAFASQAALALEVAEARRAQQRMLVFEDRDRIARDLHDHVIQQLFAAGMTLQSIEMAVSGRPEADRIAAVVDSLDVAIHQIRSSIFGLGDHPSTRSSGVRSAVMEVVEHASVGLRNAPDVRFLGDLDRVDAGLCADLVAVVREALANVVRHADASTARVSLAATDDTVEVAVTDDGRGFGELTHRSGLENLRRRADARGGTFEVATPTSGAGAELRWSVPL